MLTWPGINPANYDIATFGVSSKGQVVPITAEPLGVPYDLSHAHAAFVAMYDNGRMDGADKIPCIGTCRPNPQFKYVTNAQHAIDPYLTLAADYGWANAMFQTNQGPSYPAHQFLFGGTSAPSARDDRSGIFISENPGAPKAAAYKPGGSIWTAPASIRDICQPNKGYTECLGHEWATNVDLVPADVLTDIAACRLSNVS